MPTLITIVLTVLVTASSFGYGYWLANKHREISDQQWFEDLTFDDYITDTPIAHKLDREFGFEK